ncbi:hypothetical protein B7492_34325 (plasmid) [Bacillus mycoides]|uniref:DUF2922 domain-containing protein n=1 Tax=Bacillus mycoides TaxID=1405 RepID=A0A1W6AJU9_BACMY|nr:MULTISPECIES: hypothetical protein [Bacillus cereus group]ARJ26107.1 hypothetical protein B7492_34325 [Bacillus mycoides]KLA35484.1 hypothetical protein B4080_5897 [Bacillus cereus]
MVKKYEIAFWLDIQSNGIQSKSDLYISSENIKETVLELLKQEFIEVVAGPNRIHMIATKNIAEILISEFKEEVIND